VQGRARLGATGQRPLPGQVELFGREARAIDDRHGALAGGRGGRGSGPHLKHEPPSSKLGEAVRYFTNHSEALGRFLTNGAIPIDNGIVERLHVRAALSRKNYLFAGSDAGGERAAIAYTILACCRLSGVNPVEYLADVLPRLSRRVRLSEVHALVPAAWQAARTGQAAPAP
jgi:hypothetical protein